MEHAKKMTLMNSRVLENIQPQLPFSAAASVGGVLQRLVDEMRDKLDRGDLHEREEVVLYNQMLTRYNQKKADDPLKRRRCNACVGNFTK